MSKLNQKVELTANIFIILVAVLLGSVLAQKYFSNTPSTTSNKQRQQPVVGSKLNVSGINFSAQPKTLILALQKGCRFCTESAPFYKRLVQEAQNKNIKLVAVLPGKIEESAAYLSELRLHTLEVKQSSLNSLQTSGTPTLVLTNEKGEITDYWVGKLPPEKEADVLNKL